MSKSLTVAVPREEQTEELPRVRVFIPESEEVGTGMKLDHYEHVTINGETTLIRKGMYVDVTVPVFMQLRNKYPNL